VDNRDQRGGRARRGEKIDLVGVEGGEEGRSYIVFRAVTSRNVKEKTKGAGGGGKETSENRS